MSPLARALLAELAADPEALGELAEILAPYLPQPTPADEGWIDTRAAARYLGMTVTALYRLTSERAIPFAQDRPGAKCWFKRSELDAWRRGGAPSSLRKRA